MKILLSNHHLTDYAGSEMFTLTLADYLHRKGHEVTVYSKYLFGLKNEFEIKNIRTVSDLRVVQSESFDLAHVHHNINAIEVRHYFPRLPMVYMSHGAITFLEQPSIIDLHISHFVVISEGVRDHLIAMGISPRKISIIRNIIDGEQFFEIHPIRSKPQSALILSSRINPARTTVITQGCQLLGIDTHMFGDAAHMIENNTVGGIINSVDIVFTLGRGAMESMFCGRIPFIFDHWGGDGMVTPENFSLLMTKNFSGRLIRKEYTSEEIASEIKNNYKLVNGHKLRTLAMKKFNASKRVTEFISLYERISKKIVKPMDKQTKMLLNFFVNQFEIIRMYSQHEQQQIIENDLKQSKVYSLWQDYCNIRKKITDFRI